MMQQSNNNTEDNPLSHIFQEGVEEFVAYQKEITKDYKSRGQKTKERIQKLTTILNDSEQKKLKRQKQKQAQRNKISQIIDLMSKEEARHYLDGIKKAKANLKYKVREAMSHGQMIMLDLVYEQKMNEKENRSLAKQIQLIMRAIKHFNTPPSIHLCSFYGKLKQQMEKMKYQHWALTSHSQNVLQIGQDFNKKLVYLSPDALEPLQSIDKDTAYILGGLVDRTVLKDASLRRAEQLGIPAKRLPILQFMTGRLCLNLDHVVSMLGKFAECNNWKEAFDYAAPKRWKKDQLQTQKKQGNYEEQDAEQTQICQIPQEMHCIQPQKVQILHSDPPQQLISQNPSKSTSVIT